MAISHISETIKANPWVQPFSLELMAKVNTYKQGEFYKNAAKVDNMLTQLNNADNINDEKREYLKSKVSNLTTQLNNMGGINYSDMNIANAIEGFGAEIYGDEKVLEGITSTKKIREFQKNVQKMATDPKLSKYYNTSNITRILEQQINPYINGGLDAPGYSGPSAPRPYEGNPYEKMLKLMKNLPSDIGVSSTESGDKFLYRISSKERLTDEDISKTFDGLIDANTKAQLVDDAWYNFDYATGYKFSEELGQKLYSDDLLNKVDKYKSYITGFDHELKTQSDPKLIKELEDDKVTYQKAIDLANYEITKNNNKFSQMWKQDPTSAKYSLYVGRMRDDIISSAGYTKEKVTYIKNEEAAFWAKKQLEYIKLGLQLNSDGSTTKIPGAKVKGSKDDKDGTGATTEFGDLAYSRRTATKTEAQAVNEESITKKINATLAENNFLANNFIRDFAQQNDFDKLLGYQLKINTTGFGPAQTYQSDFINKIKGSDNILQEKDIVDVVMQSVIDYNLGKVTKDGKDANGNPYVYNVMSGSNKYQVTFDQMKVLDQLRDSWHKYGKGELAALPESMQKVLPQFVKFAEQHQINELNVTNDREYIQKVKDTAMANATNLTASEKKEYQEFISNPASQGNTITTGSVYKDNYDVIYKEDSRWKYLQSKFSKRDYDKSIKGAYASESTALNYYNIILPENPKKLPQGIKNKIIKKDNLPVSDAQVEPISIVRKDDGSGFQVEYKWGKEGKKEPGSVDLSDAEAAAFGIYPLADPSLEKYFTYNKNESPEFFIFNNYLKKPIFYTIINTPSGYYPRIKYNNEKVILKLPNGGYTNTANAAKKLVSEAVSQNYPSTDALIQSIKDLQ